MTRCGMHFGQRYSKREDVEVGRTLPCCGYSIVTVAGRPRHELLLESRYFLEDFDEEGAAATHAR